MRKLHHICIQTDCYRESLEFYSQILGFRIVQESPDFHSRDYNSWLESDGLMVELQTGKRGQELTSSGSGSKGIVHLAYWVDDIQKEYMRIRDLGYGRFKAKDGADIYSVEGGRLFKLLAPEGTVIEFRDKRGI